MKFIINKIIPYIGVLVVCLFLAGTEARGSTAMAALANSVLNTCDCTGTGDLFVDVMGNNVTTGYTTVAYLVDGSGNIVSGPIATPASFNGTATGNYTVYVVNYDATDAATVAAVGAVTTDADIQGLPAAGCADFDSVAASVDDASCNCGCTSVLNVCDCNSPTGDLMVGVQGNNTTAGYDTWYIAIGDNGSCANNQTGSFPGLATDGYTLYVVNYDTTDPNAAGILADINTCDIATLQASGDCVDVSAPATGSVNDPVTCPCSCTSILNVCDCNSSTGDLMVGVQGNNTAAGYDTWYIAIGSNGSCANNQTGSFPGLAVDSYTLYVVNYDTTDPNAAGILADINVCDIAALQASGDCVDVSASAAGSVNDPVTCPCGVSCPTVAITDDTPTVCDGGLGTELGDWQTAVTGTNPATDPDMTSTGIVYSSTNLGATTTTTPDGNVSGITGVHSGADNCTPETQTVYAYLGCDSTIPTDGVTDSYQLAGTLTLTVYPDIANQANVVNNDGACGPSLTLECPAGYTVTNDFDGNGANPSFTAGTSGSLNFTIALDPAVAALTGTGCEDFVIPATFNCTAPSVSVDKNDADNGDDTQTIPVGGTATFTITVTNTGSEDLCNVTVTDPNGASCAMTYTANGGTLVVGDSWTYTCTVTNVTADFINTAFVEAEGCNSGTGVDDDDPTEVFVTCLANAGLLSVAFTCPGDETMCTVTAYTDDPGFETWIVITDLSGTILDVLGPVNANGQLMIPYSYWQGLGVGQDYFIYAYNFDTTNPPTVAPTPATTIGQDISILANPSDGCSDLTNVGSPLFVPAPLITDCNNQMDEGNQGGITPFYYNEHEMCIKGGTPPYSFNWCTQGYVRHTTSGAIDYGNGVYGMEMDVIYSDNAVWAVTITDVEGCTVDDWKFTNDPVVEAWQQTGQSIAPGSTGAVLDVFHSNIIPAGDCYDLNDGSIEVCVEGGYSGEYTYDWTGPFTWTDGPMLNVDPVNSPSTVPGTNNVVIQNANDFFGGVPPVTDPSHCYPGSGLPAVGTMNCFTLSGLTQGWYTLTVTDQGTGTTGSGPNPNTSPGSSDIQETVQWFWVHCNFPYTNPNGTGGDGRGKVMNLQGGIGIAAYPNPFSGETTLEFGINESEKVEIGLYGVDGKRMGQLFNGQAKAGQIYQLPFKADRLPSGVYIVKLTTESGKMKHAKLFVSP